MNELMNERMGSRWTLLVVSLPVLLTAMFGVGSGDAQLDRLRKLKKESPTPAAEDTSMVLIPQGLFWMGRDGTEALEDERPRH
jgi:hypothetical protein